MDILDCRAEKALFSFVKYATINVKFDKEGKRR